MSSRMFLRGKLFFADAGARKQMALARKTSHAVAPAQLPGVRLEELEHESTEGREAYARATGALPILPASPASPFRDGTGYFCREDRLTYRVLASFDPTQGWAPAQFWKDRWLITYGGLLQLAREGLVDAILLEGSQIRRYRCRDEARVLRSAVVVKEALARKRRLKLQVKPRGADAVSGSSSGARASRRGAGGG